ncbi:hypothetical protein ElyMa_003065800 [Elysia marginata]|uniref:Uncharacterized protein n=1 Tax=Elysia marginata TaxID=1093978 RepID=A0AAV4IKD2_9GAST|nr:hypothetical protein ElyMa_003065800 [Elysia marginata]
MRGVGVRRGLNKNTVPMTWHCDDKSLGLTLGCIPTTPDLKHLRVQSLLTRSLVTGTNRARIHTWGSQIGLQRQVRRTQKYAERVTECSKTAKHLVAQFNKVLLQVIGIEDAPVRGITSGGW